MSEHDLEQSLSALMDGEASELELHRILRELDDAEVRQTWQRLHQVRSAMHQKPFVDVDVSAGVRAALADVEMDGKAGSAPAGAATAPSGWRSWQRMAVAASVTLAVLGGVRFYNQEPAQTQLAQSVTPAVQTPAASYIQQRPVVLASYGNQSAQEEQGDMAASSQWHREQLPLYLRQHAQQAGVEGVEGSLPYARTASMEGR